MTDDFGRRGIGSARLDADLLVAHVLDVDRVALFLDLDRPLMPEELKSIRALVERRRRFEPMAYILGHKEFFGRSFAVTPGVLIPRPDTETLVERALEILPKDAPIRILDLCTGSGAIGLTLAAERPEAHVELTDVSAEALSVAEANAQALGVDGRVTLLEGDLFEAVPDQNAYDLIATNPPYIQSADMDSLAPDIAKHEPRLALDGGPDGLAAIRRIAAQASDYLGPGGTLLVELGQGQAPAVAQALEAAGFEGVRAWSDLGDIERVVEGKKPV